jgi:hypothetical protein
MPWWIWAIAGLSLLGAELLTPGGFYLLFFGLAALVVGAALGLGLSLPLWSQGVGFVVLAVLAVLVLRRPAQRWLDRDARKQPSVDSLVGARVVALGDIPPGRTGSVALRGTVWQARNSDAGPIPEGLECRVSSVRGITLTVSAATASPPEATPAPVSTSQSHRRTE